MSSSNFCFLPCIQVSQEVGQVIWYAHLFQNFPHFIGIHTDDNHNGMITDLEPDILECEVKWDLGSITTNKASGGDGILAELLKTLKDDADRVLHLLC